MGRRPKPTALKELAGNPGKRELNAREPRPRARRPKMPAHLSPEGQTEWRRITRELRGMNLLSSADADAVAMYADTYDRWVQASAALRMAGMVVMTENGFPVQSPYIGIINQCMRTMQRLLIEFGMTPAARSRIQAPEAASDDPFDEFLRQRP